MRDRIDSALPDPPDRPYSQGVRAGPLVFVAGQVPVGDDGEPLAPDAPGAQADRVIDRLETVVRAAGGSLDDVCRLTVYLADFVDFAAVNAVCARRFQPPYPVRTTIAAGLLRPEFRVEMDAIAVVPTAQETS